MVSDRKENFIQEYLYIEEIPLQKLEEEKNKIKKEEEVERGVIILEIL